MGCAWPLTAVPDAAGGAEEVGGSTTMGLLPGGVLAMRGGLNDPGTDADTDPNGDGSCDREPPAALPP